MDTLVLLGSLFGICTLVLPVVAFFRTFRISSLEQELHDVRLRLTTLEANQQRAASTRAAPPPLVPAAVELPTPAPVAVETPAPAPPPPIAVTPAPKPRPPPPPIPSAPRAPLPPAPSINWEQWLGIRGAAVAGAVVLALASVLFVRYSIEQGWLSPAMRVALGALASIAALVSSEALRKRFGDTSNGLAAAGIVGLYAATWAARSLYQLIPMELAFVLMALTTAVCALLAVRHHTLLVAVLGLAGGFATPFLLSTGSNRPVALFGYVLLLDVAFVAVAIRKKWHSVALLALLGTTATQLAWVWRRAEPQQVLLALGVLAVFTALFAVALNRPNQTDDTKRWLITRVAAVLLPFGFALYFALLPSWPLAPLPLAGFLALLCAAALWVSEQEKIDWLALSATTAAAGVLLLRSFVAPRSGTPWQWVGAISLLAGVMHGAVMLKRRQAGDTSRRFDWALVSMVSLLGCTAASLLIQRTEPTLLPYAVLGLALAGAMYERAAASKQLGWATATSAALGGYWALLIRTALSFANAATLDFTLLTLAAVAATLLVFGLRSAETTTREGWLRASTVLSVTGVLFFTFTEGPSTLSPTAVWLFVAALAALATFAGSAVDRGVWLPVTVGVTAFFAFMQPVMTGAEFATLLALGAAFTFWPLLAGKNVQTLRAATYASAGAGALLFLQLYSGWVELFGKSAIGGLPLLLAALPLIALAGTLPQWKQDSVEHRRALTWYGAVALCFIALAIPLQLDRQWIWVAWAAQGTALIALLWPRVNHPGLRYFGVALLVLAVGGLTLHPLVSPAFFAQERALPLLNWTLYSYGVPFIGLLWATLTFNKLEKTRHAMTWGLTTAGALTLWLGFVWINVAIADVFSQGNVLAYHHVPAHDLAMSVAWGIYALIVLGVGMRRDSKALRWSSLSLFFVTLGKVFLYDLGHLTDLYRAASLLGLGVSLFLVSIAYQRFVFAKKPSDLEPT